jgi:hypothetical protein
VTGDRELSAIVAHGLLNTLAVLHGAAASLNEYGSRLSLADRETLWSAIELHGEAFSKGLEVMFEACSPAFADAASAVALLSRAVRSADTNDLVTILDGFVSKTAILRIGLEAQVRALPHEVLDLLESLRH